MYESAKINGILHEVNIATLRPISNSYQNIDLGVNIFEKIISKFISTNSDAKIIDIVEIFRMIKYDLMQNEQRIVKEIDEDVATINEIRAKKLYKN